MSTGMPPVAIGPGRLGVIRISDSSWMRIACRYSAVGMLAGDAAEVVDQAVRRLRHVQHVRVAVHLIPPAPPGARRAAPVTRMVKPAMLQANTVPQ
jgi:hypothetical protein